MKRLLPLLALAALAAPAGAQLPFSSPPRDFNKPAECTKDYVAGLELQISALEKMRQAGPEVVGQVCALLEQGSQMLGGELSDATRQRIKGLFGFDPDFRFMKAQCRQGQGNLERELMSELGFLKAEQIRCSADRV